MRKANKPVAPSALPPLRVLELFAGSCSIGKVATAMGMKVKSVDLMPYEGVDVVGDLLGMTVKRFADWAPDIIWASPPCTGFSVASIGHHWGGGHRVYQPKSATAYLGLALVKRTQEIIAACPDAVWFMENPRGVLRKLPITQGFGIHHTVSYCRYGDTRMKPTDIWTNCTTWTPRAMCKNGESCHEAAPRGSRTGTQGLKGAHQRAIIPEALCREVLEAAVLQRTMDEHVAAASAMRYTNAALNAGTLYLP